MTSTTDDTAKGGLFSGSRSTTEEVTSPGATPEGQVTTPSSGGLFPGRSNTAPNQPSATPTDVGITDDVSRGGLFEGTNTGGLDVPTGARPTNVGTSSDEARGGLFEGTGSSNIIIRSGNAGRDGRNGMDGRGIASITANGDVLTITYTDGTSPNTFTIPTITGAAGRGIVSIAQQSVINNTVTLRITYSDMTTEDVSFNVPSGSGPTPNPTITRRVLINFGSTVTASINGVATTVAVDTTNNTIRLTATNEAIADSAAVEVNGVDFLPTIDYMIVSGLLTFVDFQLQLGDGDVVLITYTEIA